MNCSARRSRVSAFGDFEATGLGLQNLRALSMSGLPALGPCGLGWVCCVPIFEEPAIRRLNFVLRLKPSPEQRRFIQSIWKELENLLSQEISARLQWAAEACASGRLALAKPGAAIKAEGSGFPDVCVPKTRRKADGQPVSRQPPSTETDFPGRKEKSRSRTA